MGCRETGLTKRKSEFLALNFFTYDEILHPRKTDVFR